MEAPVWLVKDTCT